MEQDGNEVEQDGGRASEPKSSEQREMAVTTELRPRGLDYFKVKTYQKDCFLPSM